MAAGMAVFVVGFEPVKDLYETEARAEVNRRELQELRASLVANAVDAEGPGGRIRVPRARPLR